MVRRKCGKGESVAKGEMIIELISMKNNKDYRMHVGFFLSDNQFQSLLRVGLVAVFGVVIICAIVLAFFLSTGERRTKVDNPLFVLIISN